MNQARPGSGTDGNLSGMSAHTPVWPQHPTAPSAEPNPEKSPSVPANAAPQPKQPEKVVWPQVRPPQVPANQPSSNQQAAPSTSWPAVHKPAAPTPQAPVQQAPAPQRPAPQAPVPQQPATPQQRAPQPAAPQQAGPQQAAPQQAPQPAARTESLGGIPQTKKKAPAAQQPAPAPAPQAAAPAPAAQQPAPTPAPAAPAPAAPAVSGGGVDKQPHGKAAAYARALYKRYGQGDTAVVALGGVDVDFARGQFTAIMGPSGSGKSTLMHCMAGLDSATSGSVFIGETDLSKLGDKEMTALRRERLGFIFQSFNLVPTLTAAENITLPLDIAGTEVDQAWFEQITQRLGLADRLDHRPAELSGGQQQRVACARALVSRPEIIFGDEPTGNLDSNSSAEVMNILRTSVDQDGQTVVIVTHDARAASYADRVVFLADGMIVNELRTPSMDQILAAMSGIER